MIDPHEDEHARRHRHFVHSRRYGPPHLSVAGLRWNCDFRIPFEDPCA